MPPAAIAPRHVETVSYSASLRDENLRREGGPVPDFAPAVPPIHGAWLARNNRDEVLLSGRPGPAPAYRPESRQPRPTRAGNFPFPATPTAANPAGPAAAATGPQQAALVRAYRVIASLPRALTLDVLA